MSIIINENSVDTMEFDQRVASTVQAMRASLGVTVSDLAKASGVPRQRIQAIEFGNTTTRSERHEIADAVAWLSNHALARSLTARP